MLKLLLKLRALNAFLKKNLARFCALIMFVLVFIVLLGVATRYLYGQQAKFTDESARMLLIWLSFFGGRNLHVFGAGGCRWGGEQLSDLLFKRAL